MVRKRWLLEEWDKLATACMTVNMPQYERDERKRMFFAGAIAAVTALSDNGLPNLSRLRDLAEELAEWAEITKRIIDARERDWENKDMPAVKAEAMRKIEQFARTAFGALDYACDNVFQRRELGAALFVFSFLGPELTYISNADRKSMMKMLQEFIAHNPPEMTWDEQHG